MTTLTMRLDQRRLHRHRARHRADEVQEPAARRKDWCKTHHPGSPITEIGPGGKRAAPKKPSERPSR